MKTKCKSMHNYYSMERLEKISEEWTCIEDFIEFYADHPPPVPMAPPENGVYVDDIVYGVVMLRVKQYQCQLFICKPNAIIPEHTHPNADASEVHISGMLFSKRGHPLLTKEIMDMRNEDGLEAAHGRVIKIGCTDKHNAESSDKGGAFLTFQKWHEGHTPDSLGIDWEGTTVGLGHKNMIEEGTMFDEPGFAHSKR